MKKTVYLLGLTLLCGFQAQAQNTPEQVVLFNDQENNFSSDADKTENIAQAAVPAEDEQTIFFSDDLLDETDEELKAPLFVSDDKVKQPKASDIPLVKIPEEVKTPAIKPAPVLKEETEEAFPVHSEEDTIAAAAREENETDETAHSIETNATPQVDIEKNGQEEVMPLQKNESPEVSDDALTGHQPQAETIDEQDEKAVEEPVIPKIEEHNGNDMSEQNEHPAPADASETENSSPEIPAVAETAEVSDTQSEEPTAPDTVETAEVPAIQPEEPAAPVAEKAAEVSNTLSEQAEATAPKEKPAPKKNAFSLDEKALLQQQVQNNSYSLDSSALSGSFLKSDALSPSVLNRSIINISPEQRAKMMMKKKYDEMDANQDGMVSEEEFVEYKTQEARKIAHQVFRQIDRNDDKMLSQYEYGLLVDKMIENFIRPQQKK